MIQLYMSLIDDEQDKLRFEIAYYKYRNLLHYKARSILKDEHRAEDAVQEVFMRIAKNFHKVGDINSPQTRNFFVLITERVALNIAEREERFKTASEEELYQFHNFHLAEYVEEAAQNKALIDAILSLPKKYREILYLSGIYGFDVKEAARLLGISSDVAWKRLYRARNELKKVLDK